MRILALSLLAFVAAAAPASAATRTIDVPHRAALTLAGERTGDLAGASVASAGDVNGDGRRDLIVGAPLADRGGVKDAGSAYVIFGGGPRGTLRLGALGDRGFRIDGTIARPRTFHPGANPLASGAGRIVAGAGDVNGDGLDDLLVSGLLAGGSRTLHAAFVVFGKRDTAPVSLGALGAGGFAVHGDDDFITALAGRPVGDVNGDGRADLGVALAVDSDEDAGSVAIVFGKADASPVDVSANRFDRPAWGIRVSGGTDSMLLGSSDGNAAAIAPAGDVNRDGLADVLLGAPGAPQHRIYGTGAVFVVYGSRDTADLRVRTGQRFAGYEVPAPVRRTGFGASVAALGRSGVLAGAPGNPIERLTGRGAVWVVSSRGAKPSAIPGPRTGGPIGTVLAAPGDVNGDGRADVLVVDRGKHDGAVSARLLSTTGRTIAVYRGLRNGTSAYASIAGAGNVGGDRRPDVLLGSPGTNRAYLLTSLR